jgi:hypothetical protein
MLQCEAVVKFLRKALVFYYSILLYQISYWLLCSVSKGTSKSMASKDFQNLMDLLFKQRQRIEKLTVNFDSDGAWHAHINFIGSTNTFASKEPDVAAYALRLRKTIDSDGNYELGSDSI